VSAAPPDWSAAHEHLCRVDPRLRRIIERVGPCRIAPPPMTIFHSLARSIVHQQLAGRAAESILARVESLFHPELLSPTHIAGAPAELLCSAGLSRNKAAALKDLAAHTLSGAIPEEFELCAMSDEEIITRVTQVKGIGRWTAEMMLMFRLCRPDVLPVDDYGVRKGFQLLYRLPELPTREQMLRRGERWRPWRSVASWYLWRVLEMPRRNRKTKPAPRSRTGKPTASSRMKPAVARAAKPRRKTRRPSAAGRRQSR
jgi:3-methyladenine DNA glycosylase/8-oxoguanine DNA glycosylase